MVAPRRGGAGSTPDPTPLEHPFSGALPPPSPTPGHPARPRGRPGVAIDDTAKVVPGGGEEREKGEPKEEKEVVGPACHAGQKGKGNVAGGGGGDGEEEVPLAVSGGVGRTRRVTW